MTTCYLVNSAARVVFFLKIQMLSNPFRYWKDDESVFTLWNTWFIKQMGS